jgi:hypothetical protein
MPNDNLELTAEEMKARLGRPPLMIGESEDEYWSWWMLLADEHQPKTPSQWMDFNDYAHKQWEKRRLQRYAPALMEGSLYQAVVNVLKAQFKEGIPEAIARDYCKGDAEAKQEAREAIARRGLTEDHLMAEALQMCGDGLAILDRMDKHRASAIRLLQKDMDRPAEARRKEPDQPTLSEYRN